MLRPIVVVLSAVVFTSSCGGNVKKVSCAGKDWRQEGYNTAHKGRPVRSFEDQRSACENPPGDAEKLQFIDGYTRGIIEYCTYDNGYKSGAANEKMPEVCPTEVREQYAKGYEQGRLEISERVQNLKRISDEYEQNEYGTQQQRGTTDSQTGQ